MQIVKIIGEGFSLLGEEKNALLSGTLTIKNNL
jgi:hypothetical protein